MMDCPGCFPAFWPRWWDPVSLCRTSSLEAGYFILFYFILFYFNLAALIAELKIQKELLALLD